MHEDCMWRIAWYSATLLEEGTVINPIEWMYVLIHSLLNVWPCDLTKSECVTKCMAETEGLCSRVLYDRHLNNVMAEAFLHLSLR